MKQNRTGPFTNIASLLKFLGGNITRYSTWLQGTQKLVRSSETSKSLVKSIKGLQIFSNTCCFDLWIYVILSKGKLVNICFSHWEVPGPFIFFQFKAIHLFAINELKSIKVLSALLKLCLSGYIAIINNLESSVICFKIIFSITFFTSIQNVFIWLHSHIQCINVPFKPHFIHISGMFLLYLFNFTGVVYIRISHLNCNILKRLLIDIVWTLLHALSQSRSLILADRSSFQEINFFVKFSDVLHSNN